MPAVLCKRCSASFYAKPNWIKIGKGKYCSRVCSDLSRRNGRKIKCHFCSKEIYKPLKSIKSSQSGNLFCGRKCCLLWHNNYFVQEKHGNWKNGEFSYKRHVLRNKVEAYCRLCGKNDPRILLIHHLDKNRTHNNLKNLTWVCYNCHFLIHHYPKEEKVFKEKINALPVL